MKIALLPSAYAPSVGGVEVLTHRLAVNLRGAGHEVEIWTGRSAGDHLSADEQLDGLRVRRFVFAAPRMHPRGLAQWPLAAVHGYTALRRAAREFNPDVLHVQCFSANGAYASALSRLTGVPLVVTLQGETVMDDNDIYEHSAFLQAALRAGLRHAAVVTGCSQFTLDDVQLDKV